MRELGGGAAIRPCGPRQLGENRALGTTGGSRGDGRGVPVPSHEDPELSPHAFPVARLSSPPGRRDLLIIDGAGSRREPLPVDQPVTIGRAPGCDARLDDASASRRRAPSSSAPTACASPISAVTTARSSTGATWWRAGSPRET